MSRPIERNAEPGASTILELRGIRKTFGGVVALQSGQMMLESRSIHALVGENGAGKSTMVKIIAGLYSPDDGSILLDGREVEFRGTSDSKTAGIAVIYQEPTLYPDLTVMENIFIGRLPLDRLGRVDRRAMRRECLELFERLGVRIDPDRVAAGMSIADQQIIEIAKALSLDARILVMDEPTAALSGNEVERLFSIARALRDQGCAIVFISHRFDEVFSLCDTITVMRDGSFVSADPIDNVDVATIVRRMVGRDVTELFPKQIVPIGEVRLEVRNLCSAGLFRDISFSVRAGEVVCLAGLVGAGRSEVARAIFGVDKYDSGEILVDGARLHGHSPAAATKAGIALVPEDRRAQGLVMESSISRNLTLAIRGKLATFGMLGGRTEDQVAGGWAATLQVQTKALDVMVDTLSGGNQQKVVLGKWMATEPSVLIVDEPTRGIDVGTKSEVHRLIGELARSGVAILMISSELPEVLGTADRVVVMREGLVTAEISRAEATAESVMYAATHARSAA